MRRLLFVSSFVAVCATANSSIAEKLFGEVDSQQRLPAQITPPNYQQPPPLNPAWQGGMSQQTLPLLRTGTGSGLPLNNGASANAPLQAGAAVNSYDSEINWSIWNRRLVDSVAHNLDSIQWRPKRGLTIIRYTITRDRHVFVQVMGVDDPQYRPVALGALQAEGFDSNSKDAERLLKDNQKFDSASVAAFQMLENSPLIAFPFGSARQSVSDKLWLLRDPKARVVSQWNHEVENVHRQW